MLSLSSFIKKNYSGDLFFDVLIIGLFYIYVFTSQAHGEVSRGAAFRIGRVLAQKQAPSDTGVKQASNTVIKMGLVTLPLDSGPTLAVGQWIAW